MNPLHSIECLNPRSPARLSTYLSGLVQNRLWLKVLIGMAPGLLSSSSLGAPLLDDAYEHEGAQQTVERWQTLAAQGNATAQLRLGQLYQQGKGVTQDDTEAVKWYRMASGSGSDLAGYKLVLMQHQGRAAIEDLANVGLVQRVSIPIAVAPIEVTPEQQTRQARPETTPEQSGLAAPPAADELDWLSRLPPEAYLIQVLATTSHARLQKYLQDNLASATPAPRIVQTRRDSQNWYQLLMGPFDTRQAALEVLAQLPAGVQKNEPWLRRARSLQN